MYDDINEVRTEMEWRKDCAKLERLVNPAQKFRVGDKVRIAHVSGTGFPGNAVVVGVCNKWVRVQYEKGWCECFGRRECSSSFVKLIKRG